MYPGLKTKLKRVITNPELHLTDQWGYEGENRTHKFFLIDNDTIIISVKHTAVPRYIDSENYDTGQITREHHGDDHYYHVNVPYTNYTSQSADNKDCEDLYKLCQARQEFSKIPVNRLTMKYLSQRHAKQK